VMHAREMHAYEIHAREVHAREVHAYQMHAREVTPMRHTHGCAPMKGFARTLRARPQSHVCPSSS
jgi:hypothetical protein